MTTIIPAAGSAQFLSLLPHLAGFRPVRSLVLVPFHGSRTLGVLRVDLPPADADVSAVAATLTGMICRVQEADAVAIVVCTDAGFVSAADEDGGVAHGGLVEALMGRADACGLRVADALCVAADGWGGYLGDGARHPLDELPDETLTPDGLPEPAEDQSAGTTLPEVDSEDSRAVEHALSTLGAAVEAVCAATGGADAAREDLSKLEPPALAAACALEDIPALFEDALTWHPDRLRPYDAAALVWCLGRPALRDVALVQWCAGIEAGDAALEAQLEWEDGVEYPAHLASRLWGEGERPVTERLLAAIELARTAASLAPRDQRAGALATAAWLSWALGRSTHSSRYARWALEAEPGHGLASIVTSMLEAGHLPDWAFRPGSGEAERVRTA
jgi:hypothetical protein